MTQDDSLITTLTVFETLMYSAYLQLPSGMSKFQMQNRVHHSIREMGLQGCVDTRVGGWHVRGLSGGEKRRLSIAIETLRQPSLFFLDEPTSGLDRCIFFKFMVLCRDSTTFFDRFSSTVLLEKARRYLLRMF